MTSPRIFRVFRIFTKFILFFILFHYPLITLRCLWNISNLSNGAIPGWRLLCKFHCPPDELWLFVATIRRVDRVELKRGEGYVRCRHDISRSQVSHERVWRVSSANCITSSFLSFRFPWRLDSVNRSVRNYLEKETGLDFPRFVIVIVEK